MRIFRTLLVMLSALLIAAHFLRYGSNVLVLLALSFPLLLLLRHPWAIRMVQIFLLGAAAEWIHTLLVLADARRSAGEPWIRMAIILGVVAAVTLLAAILIRQAKAKKNNSVPH